MNKNDTGLLRWLPSAEAALPNDFQPLIDRCLAGDDGAYAQLYRLSAGPIYRLCYSLLGHTEDAEEVLQDAFEYAFRRLDTFDPRKSAFKTWLYRIAISRCRNKRRRKWLPTQALQTLIAADREPADRETPTPAEVVQLAEAQQRVYRAIEALSPKLREVAVLRYFEGLAYGEIGEMLDIPAKTAESRMRLAHNALRDALDDLSDGL